MRSSRSPRRLRRLLGIEEQNVNRALRAIRRTLLERAGRLHGCLAAALSGSSSGGARRPAEIDVGNLDRFDREVAQALRTRSPRARVNWLWQIADRWSGWLAGG